MARNIYPISSSLFNTIKHYARFPQHSKSLKEMVEFGRNPSQDTLLKAAQYLRQELPVRLAHRVLELDALPDGLSEMPSVQRVKGWYALSFEELTSLPTPKEMEELLLPHAHGPAGAAIRAGANWPSRLEDANRYFVDVIEKIKRRHDPVTMQIAKGILEWGEKYKPEQGLISPDIGQFLDRFYLSRIGIRILIGQHIALANPRPDPNYVGIICTKTDICSIANDAIDHARQLCKDHFDMFDAPKVQLHCDPKLTFMYIPSHLHHILFELLKNSLRATVERHGVDTDAYPPVRVIVAEGQEDVTIKVSDEGGGIPRSGMPRVWTYMYTTAKLPPAILDDDYMQGDFKAPLAGFGYGLPLSRLYARYFGGDLRIISMEGYGTDAYVHLCRLGDGLEPTKLH